MPKFKYTGDAERELAGVGVLKPDQVFSCSHEQGVALQRHAPELYELQPDQTPVTQAAKAPVKTKAQTAEAPAQEAAQTKS